MKITLNALSVVDHIEKTNNETTGVNVESAVIRLTHEDYGADGFFICKQSKKFESETKNSVI